MILFLAGIYAEASLGIVDCSRSKGCEPLVSLLATEAGKRDTFCCSSIQQGTSDSNLVRIVPGLGEFL